MVKHAILEKEIKVPGIGIIKTEKIYDYKIADGKAILGDVHLTNLEFKPLDEKYKNIDVRDLEDFIIMNCKLFFKDGKLDFTLDEKKLLEFFKQQKGESHG